MIALPQKFVHAQEPVCLDAAGGVIPCPPASDSSEGSEDSDEGNARPTATPVPPTSTAIPTATPLPISAAPTATPKEGYLGQCTPEDDFLTCKEKFVCEDGLLVIEIDLYTEGGTTYDFYCIPNENIPQLNFPIAIPTNDGPVENWGGDCSGSNGGANLDACLDSYTADCTSEGGEISIWFDPGGEGAGVYCENESEASPPAPEATPFPLSDDDTVTVGPEDVVSTCKGFSCLYAGINCSKNGGEWSSYFDKDGNVIYYCDMPKETEPQSDYDPQKDCLENGGIWHPYYQNGKLVLSTCEMPKNTESFPANNLKQIGLAIFVVLVLIITRLPAIQKARASAAKIRIESNRHKLMETIADGDDGSTEAGFMRIEDIKGEANNDSASKPKPAPKPKPTPPPPPSKPKPSSGKLGDFNSDGDVDGSDLNI